MPDDECRQLQACIVEYIEGLARRLKEEPGDEGAVFAMVTVWQSLLANFPMDSPKGSKEFTQMLVLQIQQWLDLCKDNPDALRPVGAQPHAPSQIVKPSSMRKG